LNSECFCKTFDKSWVTIFPFVVDIKDPMGVGCIPFGFYKFLIEYSSGNDEKTCFFINSDEGISEYHMDNLTAFEYLILTEKALSQQSDDTNSTIDFSKDKVEQENQKLNALLKTPGNRLKELSINIKEFDSESDLSADSFADLLDLIAKFHKLPPGDEAVSIYGGIQPRFNIYWRWF
jgi:hypothetical protein